MAGASVTVPTEFWSGSDVDHMRLSLNALVADLALTKNGTTTSAAVGTATDPTKVRSTAATAGTLNGAAVGSKAATDPEWVLGGTQVPTGFVQKYILYRDGNNVASVQEGKMAPTAAAVTFPTVDPNKMVVGVLTVTNTSGSNFVPGTTSLAAAGIAAAYSQQAVDTALQFRAYQVLKLQ